MSRAAAYLTGLVVAGQALAGAGFAEGGPPSGLVAQLHETFLEPVGVTAAAAKTLRLRYLAPAIADRAAFGFAVIEADFAYFCERDGLAFAAQSAPMVDQIIVSIASEIVAFGETAPNVVQYFDAFHVRDDACIWEGL